MGKKNKNTKKIYKFPGNSPIKNKKAKFHLKTSTWRMIGAVVICGILLMLNQCTVRTVIVEGNVHYTNDEIMDMVMTNQLEHNSIYLSLKYKDRGIKGIPFIEKMNVDILSQDTIKIMVYEKSVAGYIEYLGKYMYFDKDGIIVESSQIKTIGIPQITGISFDYVVLHEKIPVENEEIFQAILDITQILSKYNLSADKIYFDQNDEMTLYFDEIRVRLGDTANVYDKIARLNAILPQLSGKKGVLHMETYDETMKNITFNKDEQN